MGKNKKKTNSKKIDDSDPEALKVGKIFNKFSTNSPFRTWVMNSK